MSMLQAQREFIIREKFGRKKMNAQQDFYNGRHSSYGEEKRDTASGFSIWNKKAPLAYIGFSIYIILLSAGLALSFIKGTFVDSSHIVVAIIYLICIIGALCVIAYMSVVFRVTDEFIEEKIFFITLKKVHLSEITSVTVKHTKVDTSRGSYKANVISIFSGDEELFPNRRVDDVMYTKFNRLLLCLESKGIKIEYIDGDVK